MSFPQFITITVKEGEVKIKHLLRLDRIHCISEVPIGSENKVIVHYGTPNGAKTETFHIEEDLHDIRRQMLHAALGIKDIGCGVPDTLPLPANFFEKLNPQYSTEPRQGIMRTTGTEESPKFTTTVYLNTPPIISGV